MNATETIASEGDMTMTTVNEMRVVDKQRVPLERQHPVSKETATGILRMLFAGFRGRLKSRLLRPTAYTLSRWDPYLKKNRIRPKVTLAELPRPVSCEVGPAVIVELLSVSKAAATHRSTQRYRHEHNPSTAVG